MIDERNFIDQPIKKDLKTQIVTSQGYHYTTGCLLDYPYFKKYYKLIAIDLSKQQKLYGDRKPIQQINLTGNLDRAEGTYNNVFHY